MGHLGPERSALRRVSANMDVFGLPGTPSKAIEIDPLISNSRRTISSQHLEVAEVPGSDLLSDAEQQLCSSLRIYPMAYMAIKDQLITENISKGFVRRRSLRNLIKVDSTKSMKIYDFMVKNGWILNKMKL